MRRGGQRDSLESVSALQSQALQDPSPPWKPAWSPRRTQPGLPVLCTHISYGPYYIAFHLSVCKYPSLFDRKLCEGRGHVFSSLYLSPIYLLIPAPSAPRTQCGAKKTLNTRLLREWQRISLGTTTAAPVTSVMSGFKILKINKNT